ncbi:MAG: cytochrome P450, partial [Alphaproteobacteria bacterium]
LAFAEQPEQLQRLRAHPELLDTAVEEVLRWTSPQLHFRRTATVPTTIGDVQVAAGDRVVTWYMAANFDPTAFADPMSFDLGRSPNRHVTFGGGGPHLCLGQWMASLEVRAFLQATMNEVQEAQWKLGVEATQDGIDCNAGNKAECRIGRVVETRPMTVTAASEADLRILKESLTSTILPAFVKRCGDRCGEIYNRIIAPITGVRYEAR